MRKQGIFFVLAMLAVGGCKKEAETSSEDSAPPSDPANTPGTVAVDADVIETEVTVAGSNLAIVSDSMVPASLEPGTVAVSTALSLQSEGPQFCKNNPTHQMCIDCSPTGAKSGSQECSQFFGPGGEGYTVGEQTGGGGGDKGEDEGNGGQGPCMGLSFLDCQPVLVKLYLSIARQMVSRLAGVVKGSAIVVKIADSNRGELKPTDGKWTHIDYRVSSPNDMEFVFSDVTGKALHLTLLDKKYSMEVRSDNDSSGPAGFHTITVEYSDAETWTADIRIQSECQITDPQAPGVIGIRVNKAAGIWQGKAMMYSPHWPSGSCQDPVVTESAIGIYTDFVGEPLFTTASLYMIPTDVSSLNADNINNYGIPKLCTNFPTLCNGGSAFGSSIPDNPFCSRPDGTHVWGSSCKESQVSNVAKGVYGPQDHWWAPAELRDLVLGIGEVSKTGD